MKAIATIFSPCRTWRYTLWRQWFDDGLFVNRDRCPRFVQFIGLNPSTADEVQNDPTVTRCMNYAQDWGYDAMCMTNLFAYRATNPKVMMRFGQPIGEDNLKTLVWVAMQASLTVCCWGNDGRFNQRERDVLSVLRSEGITLHHLGLNGDGTPKHPLYLKKTLKPIKWEL